MEKNKELETKLKMIRNLKANEDDFQEIRKRLKNEANEVIPNFETNYALPDNFDFTTLDETPFKKFTMQKIPLPFKNTAFKHFAKMKKKVINETFLFSFKGKITQGAYLVGMENDKPVLFSLTIVRNPSDFRDFTLKLDMLVAGKEWLPISRLDSLGLHPNYIKHGRVVDSVEDIEYANPPHIHRNSLQTQVMSWNNLKYSNAKECDKNLFHLKDANDKTFFKEATKAFFNTFGIDASINKEIEENYEFNYSEKLFDEDKSLIMFETSDTKELSNEF